jgi:hypothetical protein
MRVPVRLRVDAHSPIPIRWQPTEQLKHVIEGAVRSIHPGVARRSPTNVLIIGEESTHGSEAKQAESETAVE